MEVQNVIYLHSNCFLHPDARTQAYQIHLNLRPEEYCALCFKPFAEDEGSLYFPALAFGELEDTQYRWKKNLRPYATLINIMPIDIRLIPDQRPQVILPSASHAFPFGVFPEEVFEVLGEVVLSVVRSVPNPEVPPEIDDVWWIVDERAAQVIWRWHDRVDILSPFAEVYDDQGALIGYRAFQANPYTRRSEASKDTTEN